MSRQLLGWLKVQQMATGLCLGATGMTLALSASFRAGTLPGNLRGS